MKEYTCPEAYKLFNGETASYNAIAQENGHWKKEVDRMLKDGDTVGQMTLEGDIVIFPIKYEPYNGKTVQTLSEHVLLDYRLFEQ